MRLHLNHRSIVRAVSIIFVVMVLGLGVLAPATTADVLSPVVDDGGSGHDGNSDFVPMTQNQHSLMLSESEEPGPPVVDSVNRRQLLMTEDKLPEDAFAGRAKGRSDYCYRCFSYR